ncbi:MAG TPA: methyltransferase domain-containing protein [Chthonomonadaceae bacterium]|nr:methyltransferase domain-containing protein [Chthonomonadaceae bacterium]
MDCNRDQEPSTALLDEEALIRSEIVANARMNRERGVVGTNSYARELGLDPLAFFTERLSTCAHVSWLDLCCGAGNALIESALYFARHKWDSRVTLVGVDLVDMFSAYPPDLSCLRLHAASISIWQPDMDFDLITCVHGLHYVGDKLGLLQSAVSWLKLDGLLLCHLDYANLRLTPPATLSVLGRDLRQAGFVYNRARHLLQRQGKAKVALPYRYLGADDQAGANYTGQPAVNSFYSHS